MQCYLVQQRKVQKQQAQDELETQAVRLNFVDLAGSEKSQQYNGPQGKNDRFAVRMRKILEMVYWYQNEISVSSESNTSKHIRDEIFRTGNFFSNDFDLEKTILAFILIESETGS